MPSPAVPWRERADVRVFLTVWLVYALYSSPAANSMAEQYLGVARGLIERGSVEMQPSVLDISQVAGRHVPGLPPGTGILCLPAVALAELFVRAGLSPDSPIVPKVFALACVWFAIAPLAALVAAAQFRLIRRLEVPEGPAIAAALVCAFGSLWFWYATRLIGTIAGSCACFLAFALLAEPARRKTGTRSALAAGFLLGAAITMDYGVTPVALGVALYALFWHGG